MFNLFVEASRLPEMLVTAIGQSGLSALAVIMILFYVVLGCFMDSLSMILPTVMPAYAIVTQLGLDPIWFGVVLIAGVPMLSLWLPRQLGF